MGVVVRMHIDFFIILLIPTPLVLAFLQQHLYYFVHFLMLFRFCLLFLCNIANIAQGIFEIVQKSR